MKKRRDGIWEKVESARYHALVDGIGAAFGIICLIGGPIWLSIYVAEEPVGVLQFALGFVPLALALLIFSAVRRRKSKQFVRAVWLRPFHQEEVGEFKVSHVIDGLHWWCIGAITLQDSRVRASGAQRMRRALAVSWQLALPVSIVGGISIAGIADRSNLDNPLMLLLSSLVLYFPVVTLMLFVAAVAAAPALERIGRRRDEYPQLGRILRDLPSRRGTQIVRISDEHWQRAVADCLSAVDVAIVDVSRLSSPIIWEIVTARSRQSALAIVFIQSASSSTRADPLWPALEDAFGSSVDRSALLSYPDASQPDGGDLFMRRLRESVYDAYDRSRKLPGAARAAAARSAEPALVSA